MTGLIKLTDVKKLYQLGQTQVEALRGVDMELEQGQYYTIIGPSGSGKSSLMHIIGCMDIPTSGEIWLNGEGLHALKQQQLTAIRAQAIGFVFQAFHLNPILTAQENVAITLRFLGESKSSAQERAAHWLERVGLADRIHHYPSELSGGERQRVAIARAVAKKPALILADEPTGNLDTKTGDDIIELLRSINVSERTTIIQVTHDSEVAARSDAIYTLRDGRIVDYSFPVRGAAN